MRDRDISGIEGVVEWSTHVKIERHIHTSRQAKYMYIGWQ